MGHLTISSEQIIRRLQRKKTYRSVESEIFLNCKFKLVDKELFESIAIVLFIENNHRFLVANRIHRTETLWAIAVCYQYGIPRE